MKWADRERNKGERLVVEAKESNETKKSYNNRTISKEKRGELKECLLALATKGDGDALTDVSGRAEDQDGLLDL